MIELHRRSDTDAVEWQIVFFTEPDEPCAFASIGVTMSLRDIYRNVRFDEAAEGAASESRRIFNARLFLTTCCQRFHRWLPSGMRLRRAIGDFQTAS